MSTLSIYMEEHSLKNSSRFVCERCGKLLGRGIGVLKRRGYYNVHHRDKNHSNNDPSNLELLCLSCHQKHHRALREAQRPPKQPTIPWVPPPRSRYTKMLPVPMEPEFAEELKALAEKQHMSRSELIRLFLRAGVSVLKRRASKEVAA